MQMASLFFVYWNDGGGNVARDILHGPVISWATKFEKILLGKFLALWLLNSWNPVVRMMGITRIQLIK